MRWNVLFMREYQEEWNDGMKRKLTIRSIPRSCLVFWAEVWEPAPRYPAAARPADLTVSRDRSMTRSPSANLHLSTTEITGGNRYLNNCPEQKHNRRNCSKKILNLKNYLEQTLKLSIKCSGEKTMSAINFRRSRIHFWILNGIWRWILGENWGDERLYYWMTMESLISLSIRRIIGNLKLWTILTGDTHGTRIPKYLRAKNNHWQEWRIYNERMTEREGGRDFWHGVGYIKTTKSVWRYVIYYCFLPDNWFSYKHIHFPINSEMNERLGNKRL